MTRGELRAQNPLNGSERPKDLILFPKIVEERFARVTLIYEFPYIDIFPPQLFPVYGERVLGYKRQMSSKSKFVTFLYMSIRILNFFLLALVTEDNRGEVEQRAYDRLRPHLSRHLSVPELQSPNPNNPSHGK